MMIVPALNFTATAVAETVSRPCARPVYGAASTPAWRVLGNRSWPAGAAPTPPTPLRGVATLAIGPGLIDLPAELLKRASAS
jgi:hypothetical protein